MTWDLGSIAALAIPTTAVEVGSRCESDRAALRAAHDAWLAAYASGDLAALERLYSGYSLIMPDGQSAYCGRAENYASFVPGFERSQCAARADPPSSMSPATSGPLAASSC